MSIEQQLGSLIADLPDGITEGVALGTGLADGYDEYDSPIGTVIVSFNPKGVSSVDFADEGFADRFTSRFGRSLLRAEPPKAWSRNIEPAIESGRPGTLPLDLRSVTPFQAEVLGVTATIPRGEVRSYAWLAKQAHRPKAVRAAGTSVASNPVPLIVPCHRVVRSDGKVGKYSLGGPEYKWELLEHEGAHPEILEDLARQRVRVRGNTSTHIYCHPTCHAIRRSKPANVVDFHTSEEAREAGFRPCELCKP